MRRLVEENGGSLASDQLEELYSKLLRIVQDAAVAEWRTDREAKRIIRGRLREWFLVAMESAMHPAPRGGGRVLRKKMEAAHLPGDAIASALESRRFYREEVLRPRYLQLKDRTLIEGEVMATLQQLRSKLDTGGLPDSGGQFHDRCLEKLDELRHRLGVQNPPPLAFMHGCMYSIADRCLHRFRRASA